MTITIEQSTYTYHLMITFSYLVGANLLNMQQSIQGTVIFKPLNAELNPICHLLALGAHRILHVSRIRVKYLSHIMWPLNTLCDQIH